MSSIEQIEYYRYDQPAPELVLLPPLTIDVNQLPLAEMVNREAETFIRKVGQLAMLGVEVEGLIEKSDPDNLMEAVKGAKNGEEQSLKVVEANVSTDVLERTIKSGLILEVPLSVDEGGVISQHSQTMDTIQKNTLLYAADNPKMRARAHAEVRNSFRIRELYRMGLLKDYSFVVFSRTADDMDDQERKDCGFFEDKPVSIQVTSITETGLKTESAFVAAVSKPGAPAKDKQVIESVGNELNVDFTGQNSTELLDHPILIHNSLIPNGAIDLVEMFDKAAGGTFFGKEQPVEDYLVYKEACIKRAESYLPKVQQIMGELIASADLLHEPIDAVKMLNKLSDQHMVEMAAYDKRIDPKVFGSAAAPLIELARSHLDRGNEELSKTATKKAQKVSDSRSCPSAIGKQAQETGEEKVTSIEDSWHGGKKHFNDKCRSCKKVKIETGACHICKDCVAKPWKMKKAFDEQKDSKEAKITSIDSQRTKSIEKQQEDSSRHELKAVA
jgi:hypothetical protein